MRGGDMRSSVGLPRLRWWCALTIVVCAGGLSTAAAADAITRAQADRIALTMLRPAKIHGEVTCCRSSHAAAAGLCIPRGGPTSANGAATTTANSGLESVSTTTWPHPPIARSRAGVLGGPAARRDVRASSVLLVVDDRTGAVVQAGNLTWVPLVNGVSGVRHPQAYTSSADRVFANDRIAPNRAGQLVSADANTSSAFAAAHVNRPRFSPNGPFAVAAGLATPDLHQTCLITLGNQADPTFAGDFAKVTEVAVELHLDNSDARGLEITAGCSTTRPRRLQRRRHLHHRARSPAPG